MELAALVFVVVVVSASAAAMAWAIRSITFENTGTDGALQVQAAAQAGKWRWPSQMHDYTKEKARMKDMGVLLLVIMQRILRDRESFYPLGVTGALVHSANGVLLFFVASAYWSTGVGLMLFGMYLACLWPYMIVLQGGYQGLAVTFLLVSVGLAQIAEGTGSSASIGWYLASGAAFGAMIFSSASSRKLIPLALAAFILSQARGIDALSLASLGPNSPADWAILSIGASLVAILGACWLSIRTGLLWRIPQLNAWQAVHDGDSPGQTLNSFQQYCVYATSGYALTSLHLALLAIMYLVLVSLALGSVDFYVALSSWLGGGALVVLSLTLPNGSRNLRRYYKYYVQSQHGGHFWMYDEYFQRRIGRNLREGTGGLRWYIGYLKRIVPFHSAAFAVATIYMVYLAVSDWSAGNAGGMAALVILGISPMIWSEVTKGPKAALPYFPAFVALLLPIGHALYAASNQIPQNYDTLFWAVVFVLAGLSALWNAWMLVTDLIPCRLSIPNLIRELDGLNINEFYTYETVYNGSLVSALPSSVKNQYKIRFIDTLQDAKEGYVVVPGISAKSMSMEGSGWAIKNGDFKSDPELTHLIETKEIEHYAVSSIKAFGTSRYWVHAYDVPSFRDLVLKEVHDEDRWRGRVWILDAAKLHASKQAS